MERLTKQPRGFRIYLAGPIFQRSNADVRGWRGEAAGLLKWASIVDPALRDFRGIEDAHSDTIVNSDKSEIATCDAVLAYAESASWGTAMEVLFAWQLRKRVVAVCSGPVSPWLRHHSDAVLRSVADACAALLIMGAR